MVGSSWCSKMWNSFSPSELLPPEAVCLFDLIEEADTHTKTRVVRSPLLAQACGDSFGVRLHIFEHALADGLSPANHIVTIYRGPGLDPSGGPAVPVEQRWAEWRRARLPIELHVERRSVLETK